MVTDDTTTTFENLRDFVRQHLESSTYNVQDEVDNIVYNFKCWLGSTPNSNSWYGRAIARNQEEDDQGENTQRRNNQEEDLPEGW